MPLPQQFGPSKDTEPFGQNQKSAAFPGGQGSKPDGKDDKDPAAKEREHRLVKQWTEKITKARNKWEPDFKRMRENMLFARGIQWQGQKTLMDDRYVCNLVQRNISQGVATLYARNPTCECASRDRLDFEIWDGKEQSIMQAMNMVNQAVAGGPVDPVQTNAAIMLIKDYSEGQLWRSLVERVGKTISTTFQYMMDSLQPVFKTQMKQLVRRVKTTGVGYVQVKYLDGLEGTLTTSETESTIVDRVKKIKHIAGKLSDEKITEEDPQVLTLATLASSVISSVQNGDTQNINQRISFDFLPSTSVILDPRTRLLKGFVGCRWMAIEIIDTLENINSFYETQIDSSAKGYSNTGTPQQDTTQGASTTTDSSKKSVCCWYVFDLDSKSTFTLVDGWKEFVEEPQAVMPETNHFWPVCALTFNDVETEPDSDHQCASIFPPSDVDLMRSAQKEWNRTRNSLRSHRVANTPCYMTGKGWLTRDDKAKISDHEDSAVVELEGAQMGVDIGKLLSPFQHAPLEPQLYDVSPLAQDIQLSAGSQEADMGRPTPRVTATGATIAEQSKNTVAASNTDDLDDFLSEVAQMGGEIILRYFKLDTVKRIAGRGAVLPQQNREDFINEINLSVKAASSGRPNKALDIANFKEIVPLIMQAIANPTGPMIGLAEEGLKRLDDRLDLSKLLAVGMPLPGALGQQQQQLASPQSAAGGNLPQPGAPNGQRPPGQLPNGSPQHATVSQQ